MRATVQCALDFGPGRDYSPGCAETQRPIRERPMHASARACFSPRARAGMLRRRTRTQHRGPPIAKMAKLSEHIAALKAHVVRPPAGLLPYRYIVPTAAASTNIDGDRQLGVYGQQYDWDAFFEG